MTSVYEWKYIRGRQDCSLGRQERYGGRGHDERSWWINLSHVAQGPDGVQVSGFDSWLCSPTNFWLLFLQYQFRMYAVT